MAQTRSLAAGMTRLLSSIAAPLYVLDDERRIVYANTACAKWLGVAIEELIGRTCSYHSSPVVETADAVVAGLCPPPEAFAGGRLRGVVSAAGNNGVPIRRQAEFIPLLDEGEICVAVLAIVDTLDLPPYSVTPAAQDFESGDESAELHEQLLRFHAALSGPWQLDRLVGVSPAMERVRAQVRLAADSKAAVVIVGPKGSGRQHVGRAIHHSRPSADKRRLTPLDCASLGPDTARAILSEHFAKRSGPADRLFDTLFLNEAHALPLDAQAELTDRLAAGEQDTQIVSTTVAPLDQLAERGEFRKDLACLLSTIVIRLSPLAERREDIPLLAQMFLEELNAEGKRQHRGFTPETLDQLAAYPWPGNIDELAAMIREAHGKAEGSLITPADLPQRIYLAAAASRRPRREQEPIDLEKVLGEIEQELIQRALRLAKGNKTKAAKLLNLTRPRLYRRMVQLGLEKGE